MRVVSTLGTLPGSKMDEPALTHVMGCQTGHFASCTQAFLIMEAPKHNTSAPRQSIGQPKA